MRSLGMKLLDKRKEEEEKAEKAEKEAPAGRALTKRRSSVRVIINDEWPARSTPTVTRSLTVVVQATLRTRTTRDEYEYEYECLRCRQSESETHCESCTATIA